MRKFLTTLSFTLAVVCLALLLGLLGGGRFVLPYSTIRLVTLVLFFSCLAFGAAGMFLGERRRPPHG